MFFVLLMLPITPIQHGGNMENIKVLLTASEIQSIVMAMEEKIDRLKGLNLMDKTRIKNMELLKEFLESHI